jgi:hypothetical protein
MKVRSVAIIIYLDRLEDVEYVVDEGEHHPPPIRIILFLLVLKIPRQQMKIQMNERKEKRGSESEQFQMDEIGIHTKLSRRVQIDEIGIHTKLSRREL